MLKFTHTTVTPEEKEILGMLAYYIHHNTEFKTKEYYRDKKIVDDFLTEYSRMKEFEEFTNDDLIKKLKEKVSEYRTNFTDDIILHELDVRKIISRIAELESEIARMKEAEQWISVEKRLPEINKEVHVLIMGKFPDIMHVCPNGKWWDGSNYRIKITHWKYQSPLPSPPNQ